MKSLKASSFAVAIKTLATFSSKTIAHFFNFIGFNSSVFLNLFFNCGLFNAFYLNDCSCFGFGKSSSFD